MRHSPVCASGGGCPCGSGLGREGGAGPSKSFAAKAASTAAVPAPGKCFAGLSQHGFTLVELVMVIALAGLVAVMVGAVMSRPMQGFVDQSRRAELVDKASVALQRMARDVRLAVPNSLTVGAGQMQMLSIAAAGRYRANLPDAAGPLTDPPQCTQAGPTCSIDILSPMTPAASSDQHWLIIYNTDASELVGGGALSVISPKAFTWSAGVLSAALQNFRFKYASPQRRFYLAREVVGYRCDGAGRLWREVSGNLNGSSPSAALVVDSIAPGGCAFSYDPGTSTRGALITLRLTLTQDAETISLLQQVHVDNAP